MGKGTGQLLVLVGAILIVLALVIFLMEKDKHGKTGGISTGLYWAIVGGSGGLGIILLIIGIIMWYRGSKQASF